MPTLLLILVLLVLMTSVQANSVNIESRLELFTDDYLIERMSGVELLLHHPIPRETVITFDQPWEGETCAYVTIFKDGPRYRMYYRGSRNDQVDPMVTCVAESDNGIHWTKPKLGLFEFDGSKQNNIIWSGEGSDEFTPFKDPNPDAKRSEEYKAVSAMRMPDKKAGLFAWVSADGYRWKLMQDTPIITDGKFDSQNLAFWDAERKEYACYYRDYRNSTREIKRSTSRDFVHWTPGEWVTYNLPPEQYYTNAITPYFRAPHIYLGFPKRLVPDRKAVEAHAFPGVSDGVFISSRDGIVFHKWLEAFHRPGLDQENWTDRNNMAAWGIHELRPGEISIYYSQHYRHPTNGMVRTTIRTDGFVSVHAGGKTGEMVTKPLVLLPPADGIPPTAGEGKELVINYSTSAAGGIRVELQDESGAPMPNFRLEDCLAIYGDQIERVVRWKSGSDVSALSGKAVRLRFELTDADLYSLRWR